MPDLIETRIPGFAIRPAVPGDAALILAFIKALAEYEKLSDRVTATEDGLRRTIFEKGEAEVVIGEKAGQPVAFALFFHTYSTFLGKAGMYLEDLFVKPGHRGEGIGREMLRALAAIAVRRGCPRLDWQCLDWNESAAGFYRGLGARELKEWITYRLDGDALEKLGGG